MQKMKQVIEEFHLTNKLVALTTDNAAVNYKCLSLLKAFNEDYRNVTHIPCIAHVLNIAVQSGLKTIQDEVNKVSKLVHFITFSGKRKQIFEERCNLLHVKHLELVKDMSVRWNSTYLMLERAIKMKEVLNYLSEERREFIEYNIDSWGNIELITKYLSVFNEATLILSKSKYPSICHIQVVIEVLL